MTSLTVAALLLSAIFEPPLSSAVPPSGEGRFARGLEAASAGQASGAVPSDQHQWPGPAAVYRVSGARHLIVRGTDSEGLSILDTQTGQVRNLTAIGDGRYTHGPTRSRSLPVSGSVQFGPDRRVTWSSDLLGELVGEPLPTERRDITVEAHEQATLAGTLFLPDRLGPHPVAVIVPLGDRSSLWDPAMWLLASGTGVFVYDQRGTGRSTGALSGTERNSHTLETLQLADDAVAVVRRVRGLPGVDPGRVGILGWSQGGWVGAMAASRLRGLAFYVNVAANANPWPEQAQHRFLTRLEREGFSGTALLDAERYFRALRAVTDFRIGWPEYREVRDRFRNEAWYRTIIELFPFFAYDSYAEALFAWSVEAQPSVFFRRVSDVPSLGIYFEFDQSNPPDSSSLFRRALEAAGNSQTEVKTFPGVNHGAWVVNGYAFDPTEIERRDPAIFDFVSGWIAAQTRRQPF